MEEAVTELTLIIGNSVTVVGILAASTYGGVSVSLLKYFNGAGATSNVNNVATSVNFLDGGGAAPIQAGMPASDTTSKQYFLLTHLYQFFGQGNSKHSNPPSPWMLTSRSWIRIPSLWR